MDKKKEQLSATRLSPLEIFFDTRATYSLEDWLFRVHSYYEMLLCTMSGPDGVYASEQRMEQMVGVLGLIQWAETLPLGSKIVYMADEKGAHRPCAIEPTITYLS